MYICIYYISIHDVYIRLDWYHWPMPLLQDPSCTVKVHQVHMIQTLHYIQMVAQHCTMCVHEYIHTLCPLNAEQKIMKVYVQNAYSSTFNGIAWFITILKLAASSLERLTIYFINTIMLNQLIIIVYLSTISNQPSTDLSTWSTDQTPKVMITWNLPCLHVCQQWRFSCLMMVHVA